MTGFNLAEALANLRYVLMLLLLQGIDWVLGVLVAWRAGEFDLRLLAKNLIEIASYIGGLALLAVGTGVVFKFGEVDAGPAITLMFAGAVAAYGAQLIQNIARKVIALPTKVKAREYGAEPKVD